MLPAEKLKNAGMTWENLSEWSPEGMTGRMWDAIIPNMGLMALIRNLRNFDEKGISAENVARIKSKLVDAETVRKSRIFPYQFYQAYRSVDGFRWSESLEIALNYSTSNIPVLKGRTLLLSDRSGSMFSSKVSDRSVVTFADVGSLFASVWKLNNVDNVDLYGFGSNYEHLRDRYQSHDGKRFSSYTAGERWTGVTKRIDVSRGGAVLKTMDRFVDMGGTELYDAVAETYRPGVYDRVIIITDEQANLPVGGIGYGRSNYYDEMPAIEKGIPVYIWNLAGYQAGITKSGRYNRHTFGGLTDTSFKMIPILESGRSVGWPWEQE